MIIVILPFLGMDQASMFIAICCCIYRVIILLYDYCHKWHRKKIHLKNNINTASALLFISTKAIIERYDRLKEERIQLLNPISEVQVIFHDLLNVSSISNGIHIEFLLSFDMNVNSLTTTKLENFHRAMRRCFDPLISDM